MTGEMTDGGGRNVGFSPDIIGWPGMRAASAKRGLRVSGRRSDAKDNKKRRENHTRGNRVG